MPGSGKYHFDHTMESSSSKRQVFEMEGGEKNGGCCGKTCKVVTGLVVVLAVLAGLACVGYFVIYKMYFEESSDQSKLIFEDNFDTLDFTKWKHEITMAGGGNNEFQMYVNDRANTYVRDGILFIKPTPTADFYDEAFLFAGTVNLYGLTPADQCTSNFNGGCWRQGSADFPIPPIRSGRLTTSESLSFTYGKVEVMAKMPTGDWIWPAIWLLPTHNEFGGWPSSGEIDIMESRGNRNLTDGNGNSVGVDHMGSTLHWGPYWPYNAYDKTSEGFMAKEGTFGSAFHKYGLEWTEDHIKCFVDDELVLNVSPPNGFWELGDFGLADTENPWVGGGKMTPFDKDFFLILNVAVGGTNGFFPNDGVNGGYERPWGAGDSYGTAMKNFWAGKDLWYPTWDGEDAAMQIDWIKVWKL